MKTRGLRTDGLALLSLVVLILLIVFRTVMHQDPSCPSDFAECSAIPVASRRRKPSRDDQDLDATKNIGASYSRFSSDLQSEDSNHDQQRKCRECAERNGHRILRALEFADEAVSGTKRQRVGLDAMLATAEEGLFKVLYVDSLSRLARELVITMPLLKKLVYVHGVRFISVSEGIDSARDNWEILATIIALQAENYIKELSHNVFRGQEGNILAGYSNGDYCFGYKSVPVPGAASRGQGRHKKPPMMYVIDDVETTWVLRIFHWFAIEKKSLRWITRELNRRGAPKDHRSTKPHWHHSQLTQLLQQRKYLGEWAWGQTKTVRDPLTGNKRQDLRPDADAERWKRPFPHLRIVSDELFAAAAEILAENAKQNEDRDFRGRLGGSAHGNADMYPSHLLSLLLVCKDCESRFYIGGENGSRLFCPGWGKGICTCQTTVRRDVAERLILQQVSEKILANPIWRQAVLDATKTSWEQQQRELPSALDNVRNQVAELDQKIRILTDLLEKGADSISLRERLDERETERRDSLGTLRKLEEAEQHRGPPPSEEWVAEQLRTMESILSGACPAAALALRKLVGGAIEIEQIERPGRRRHYLRATFTIRTANIAKAISSSGLSLEHAAVSSNDEKVIVDLVLPDEVDSLADVVKEKFDSGIKFRQIAADLGCGLPRVRKAFERWYQIHGQQAPDGRSCRKRLPRQNKAETMVDAVMEHWHKGLSNSAIAALLKCDRNLITEVVRIYHRKNGLPLPEGRKRRWHRNGE